MTTSIAAVLTGAADAADLSNAAAVGDAGETGATLSAAACGVEIETDASFDVGGVEFGID